MFASFSKEINYVSGRENLAGWISAGLTRSLVCGSLMLAGANVEAAERPCTDVKVGNLRASPSTNTTASPYALSLKDPAGYRLTAADADRLGLKATPEGHARAQRPYSAAVQHAARAYKVDAELIHAVITAESNYNPQALSPKGAYGLMQLMPDTARRYGLRDGARPECNIRAGTAYLRDLLTLFDNDVKLALAAYNAGENAVVRYGMKVPPYQETQQYVPKVMDVYSQLKPTPPNPVGKGKKRYPDPLPYAMAGTSTQERPTAPLGPH